MKYAIVEDPDAKAFLIVDKDKHIVFARGSNFDLLKDFYDYQNDQLAKEADLKVQLREANARTYAVLCTVNNMAGKILSHIDIKPFSKFKSKLHALMDKHYATLKTLT